MRVLRRGGAAVGEAGDVVDVVDDFAGGVLAAVTGELLDAGFEVFEGVDEGFDPGEAVVEVGLFMSVVGGLPGGVEGFRRVG